MRGPRPARRFHDVAVRSWRENGPGMCAVEFRGQTNPVPVARLRAAQKTVCSEAGKLLVRRWAGKSAVQFPLASCSDQTEL
jgi:hypothetical protein